MPKNDRLKAELTTGSNFDRLCLSLLHAIAQYGDKRIGLTVNGIERSEGCGTGS